MPRRPLKAACFLSFLPPCLYLTYLLFSLTLAAIVNANPTNVVKQTLDLTYKKRNPPLGCVALNDSGDHCQGIGDGIPICAIVSCGKLGTFGYDCIGGCSRCACANSGKYAVACPDDVRAPNGMLCKNVCYDCVYTLPACLFSGQGWEAEALRPEVQMGKSK